MSTKALEAAVQSAFPPCKETKGLQKLLCKSSIGIVKLANVFEIIFYGNEDAVRQYKNGQLRPADPMKLGIIPVVRLMASINYCELLNFVISKIPRGPNSKFDPKTPPAATEPGIKRSLWKAQKLSYDAQLEIDGFMSKYLDINNDESKNALFKLVKKIERTLTTDLSDVLNENILVSQGNQGGFLDKLIGENNRGFATYQYLGGNTQDVQTLVNSFPVLIKINNYLQSVFAAIRGYNDYRQVPDAEFRKLFRRIERIKATLIAIQGLSSPVALLSSIALGSVGPSLPDAAQKIQSIVRPERAIPLLKRIIKTCRKIQSLCVNLINIIQTAQLVIKIIMVIVKVIKIILIFLKILPVPNLFTVTGITTTMASVTDKLEIQVIGRPEDDNTLLSRLGQVLFILELLRVVINTVLAPINEVIRNLTLIITNLSNCANADKDLLDDLIGARDGMQKYADLMYLFAKNKEVNDFEDGIYNPDIPSIDLIFTNPPNMDDNGLSDFWGVNPYVKGSSKGTGGFDYSNIKDPSGKFGEFDIRIITEEVVEKTFKIKRRYGVALNNKGIVVVQTPPTYASDSQIIIAEVKQLLLSKNLIKDVTSLYTNEEKSLFQTVENYLFDKSLKMDNFPNLNRNRNRSTTRDGIDLEDPEFPKEQVKPEFSANDLGFDVDNAFDDLNLNAEELSLGLDEYTIDPPDNEDENVGLGLNAFINKLKGGRKLRRAMRKIMAKKLQEFRSNTDAAKRDTNIGTESQNNTTAGVQSQAPQNPNVDLTKGNNGYFGIVKNSTGSTVAQTYLRADDSDLAKQKLIDKYDPKEEKQYVYQINPA